MYFELTFCTDPGRKEDVLSRRSRGPSASGLLLGGGVDRTGFRLLTVHAGIQSPCCVPSGEVSKRSPLTRDACCSARVVSGPADDIRDVRV